MNAKHLVLNNIDRKKQRTYIIYFPELNILQAIPLDKKLKGKLGTNLDILIQRKNKTYFNLTDYTPAILLGEL